MQTQITQRLDGFFTKFTLLTYKKGEVIVRADDEPSGVFYLKKGLIRQYAVSSKGESLMIHVYRPGAFFPMTWTMNDTPNSYYFEAMTSVQLWRAPKEVVRGFLDEEPLILRDFTNRILLGVSGLLIRMELLVLSTAYDKTVELLVYFAKAIGEPVGNKGIKIPVSLTHKEIAAWIGTTRETASLQMEEIARQGLIKYDRRQIVIPDLDRLKSA